LPSIDGAVVTHHLERIVDQERVTRERNAAPRRCTDELLN